MKNILIKWNEISLVKRIIGGLIVGILLGLVVPQFTVISLLGDFFGGGLKSGGSSVGVVSGYGGSGAA